MRYDNTIKQSNEAFFKKNGFTLVFSGGANDVLKEKWVKDSASFALYDFDGSISVIIRNKAIGKGEYMGDCNLTNIAELSHKVCSIYCPQVSLL